MREFKENTYGKKLSQQELAKRAGVSQTAIYQWEKGTRIPKIEAISKIADALNVKISDLISLNDTIGSALETIEENRIIRTYSAVEAAIKDNLDKMNESAKKKVYDYTEDLIQNPKNWKENE